jgi:glycerate dehydrogenase
MKKLVVLDADSLKPSDLDLAVWDHTDLDIEIHPFTDAKDLSDRVAGAHAILLNKAVITRDIIESAPKLELIAVTATGTNNIDIEAAKERGVRVVNAVNYGTQSVVQHTLALMFSLAGSLTSYNHDVRSGQWSKSQFFCELSHPIYELPELTLGVIGYGVLGQEVARQAQLLGMKVMVAQSLRAIDEQVGRVPLDQLLTQADVITIHTPLTDQTRGLIGRRELELMKPSALLINVARGGIVDEEDLVAFLNRGGLGGFATDVMAKEPPEQNHPLFSVSHPNVIVTPHMAWGSRIARQNVVNQMAEDLHNWLENRPLEREVR